MEETKRCRSNKPAKKEIERINKLIDHGSYHKIKRRRCNALKRYRQSPRRGYDLLLGFIRRVLNVYHVSERE